MTSNPENSTQPTEIEQLLKITHLMEIIGCARSKVYELVKAGILPPPIYITSTMPRWQPKAVNEAIAKLAENSQK
jgi:predicted DNA-binding transcriptional regulator AlpA|tara:strand:- start:131 stop:355 length:225 start_codon:yes stop_codon:yes gene_type:complete